MSKEQLRTFDAAEFLKSDEMIAEFLAAASEDKNPDVLAHAIQAVARAKGMVEISKSSGITREALYKALKPNTKPRFDTVSKVISALGMRITVHA